MRKFRKFTEFTEETKWNSQIQKIYEIFCFAFTERKFISNFYVLETVALRRWILHLVTDLLELHSVDLDAESVDVAVVFVVMTEGLRIAEDNLVVQ